MDYSYNTAIHDDVIKWKHFPRYWPFVRGIHRSPGNYPNKGQWHGTLMFSLICAWINGWVNNGEAGDLGRQQAHYDVIVMTCYLKMQLRPHHITIYFSWRFLSPKWAVNAKWRHYENFFWVTRRNFDMPLWSAKIIRKWYKIYPGMRITANRHYKV